MAKGKPHMNIVFIGHVDYGKSTTVGRLLYDRKHRRAGDEKIERLPKSLKDRFRIAFVMDNLKEERERESQLTCLTRD